MLKVALGDLLEDPPGKKEGRRDMKIRSMRSKGSLVLDKGRFRCTQLCPVLRDVIVLTERMKSLSRGMRNLSVYIGW